MKKALRKIAYAVIYYNKGKTYQDIKLNHPIIYGICRVIYKEIHK